MPQALVQADETGRTSILVQYDEKIRLYESFAREVEHQVKLLLDSCRISYNSIGHRVKTRASLAEKIDRKNGKYSKLEDITDIAGVRVITYYSEDVDCVADIIESEFDVDRDNSIDKRAALEPDKFGYCSVHYVVKMSPERLALREYQMYQGMSCEIQIRSVLQHAWAEIEHDTGYKSEKPIPRELRRNFSRIAGLLEIADKEFNNIRRELTEYKKEATEKISKKEFLNKEIDAVIIDVIIQSNTNIRLLNRHIANLFGEPLEGGVDPSSAESTIEELNWLGIRIVDDLFNAIQECSEIALAVADEILKDYKSGDDNKSVNPTIGLFYLCYAVLIARNYSIEQIVQYQKDNNIGDREDDESFAQRLLAIKEHIRLP